VLYKQSTDILLGVLRYLKPEADARQPHFDTAKLTALPKPNVYRNCNCWENTEVNLWGEKKRKKNSLSIFLHPGALQTLLRRKSAFAGNLENFDNVLWSSG